MNRFLIALLLCGIFLIFPFQVYIIGNETGIGIEGALYRYQVTGYGNSLIPVTSDIMYVANGIYSGKTALSIILWALGTVLLTFTTIFGLIFAFTERSDYLQQIFLGILGSCCCYIASCIAQYGFFFHGPAGVSIPIGIFLLVVWIIIGTRYPELLLFLKEDNF